jgi:hypothetical protein
MHTFAQKPKAQKTLSTDSTLPGRAHFGESREVNSILHLQRTNGNQAAQRSLQANGDELEASSATTDSTRLAYNFSRIPIHASGHRTVQTTQTGSEVGDGHAQETDRISYDTAGKPANPLTDEEPWVEVSGDGGPETKPVTPVPADGGTVAATPPKLTKKTTASGGPTARDCGGFKWVVQWELDQQTTKGGWVVQKIESPYDIKDCSDKAVDQAKLPFKPSWYPFWEAWQINKGQKVTTYAEGGDVEDDSYATGGTGEGTKGNRTIKGEAEFYDGLTLPTSFKVTNKAPTFILPTTASAPTLSGGTGAISHNLKATWDCCSTDKTATKKTKIDPV